MARAPGGGARLSATSHPSSRRLLYVGVGAERQHQADLARSRRAQRPRREPLREPNYHSSLRPTSFSPVLGSDSRQPRRPRSSRLTARAERRGCATTYPPARPSSAGLAGGCFRGFDSPIPAADTPRCGPSLSLRRPQLGRASLIALALPTNGASTSTSADPLLTTILPPATARRFSSRAKGDPCPSSRSSSGAKDSPVLATLDCWSATCRPPADIVSRACG